MKCVAVLLFFPLTTAGPSRRTKAEWHIVITTICLKEPTRTFWTTLVDDSHQKVLLEKKIKHPFRSISRTIETLKIYCKLFGKPFEDTLYLLSARVYKITCIGCARRRKNRKTKYPCRRFAISVHAVAHHGQCGETTVFEKLL